MNNFQIDYQKNQKYITAALLDRVLNKKIFLAALKGVWVFGILSYLVILFSFFGFDISSYLILFKLFGFLGIISFVLYAFVTVYLRETEKNDGIVPGKNSYNIYSVSDFGAIEIINKIDFNNPNLDFLFSKIISKPRVKFILSQLKVDNETINIIVNDYKKNDPNKALEIIFESAIFNAIQEQESKLTSSDIFYGFIKLISDFNVFVAKLELEPDDVKNIVFWSNSLFNKVKYPPNLIERLKNSVSGLGEDWAYGYTIYLDMYSSRISGRLDSSSVGRKNIISQIETTLSKQTNNNVLLVGDLGCGKKTLVYSLASKLLSGDTSKELKHNRIVNLNIQSLMAGAQNNQEIIERLILVMQDAAHAGNIILFIDNIHVLFQGGAKVGSIDASEVLNPYLQSGSVRIIGTTNNKDYQSHLAPKTIVAGMFENIDIPPTDKDETIKILEDLSVYYVNKFGVNLTYNALKEIYKIADQYILDKVFPRKAIDLLENAMSCAKRDGVSSLDKDLISKTCQGILSIPVGSVSSGEKNSLLNLEESMHKRVVSQNDAILAVVNALKRKRAQVHDSSRPIGVFLFLGPTGVGKTEVAKTLAESYFGDEKNIIRMDMNQFQSSFSIKQFLGQKQPGLDELEGGQLVKEIKQNPFSVVLLDELEKAHKDILNIFLQIFDEGYTKDGMGDTVKFSNSIIIATSNAQANMIREGVSSGDDIDSLKEKVMENLQKEGIFTPEFLNRFDEVVMFKPLTEENLREISKNIIKSMVSDFEKKGYLIDIDDSVIDILIKKGYQPEFGARPLRRAIQDTLENYLADKIIKDEISKGEKFVVRKEDL